MKVLQTSALPLGYGAIAISLMRDSFYIIHKNTVFGNTFLKFFAGSYIFEIFCRFCKLPAGDCIPDPGVPVDLLDPGKAPAEAAKQLPRALRLKGIKKGVQWDSPPPDCGPPQISSVRPSARCGIVPQGSTSARRITVK